MQRDLDRQFIQIQLRDNPPVIPKESIQLLKAEEHKGESLASPEKQKPLLKSLLSPQKQASVSSQLSTPHRIESIKPSINNSRIEVRKLSDERRKTKDSLFRMLREAYMTRDAWEVITDDGNTALRKRVLNGDENQT